MRPTKAPKSGAVGLSAAQVKKLLFDLHLALDRLFSKGFANPYRTQAEKLPRGTCYGGPARPFMKVADVLPTLEQRVTGKALPCFIASYFGCRLGDWFATAGVSDRFQSWSTYDKSKVTIVESTRDRVVADVVESTNGDLTDGAIDYDRVGRGSENLVTSRYELTRDAKGVWRVSDRQVTFKEWECRPQ